MADNTNDTLQSLRRLNAREESTAAQMLDFERREAEGEKPDPDEFMALLKQKGVTHDAMTAQFKLYEKPIKTVLNEIK